MSNSIHLSKGKYPQSLLLDNSVSDVEKMLNIIAGIIQANVTYIENIGLANGKSGAAFFLFHYYKYTGIKSFNESALQLLNSVYFLR